MARLIELLEHGQSPWLDFISRDLLESGGFRDLVEEGIRGATSNPTIFYKAVSSTDAYDQDVRDLLEADPQASAPTLYDWRSRPIWPTTPRTPSRRHATCGP